MTADASHQNRLARETSPYLLQHASNPVDWYPWGEEAFARARDGDRPILLSVGYSSCHWCHVMAHESFEDPAVAAVMNEGFVNIKVDREERPDVDSVYMTATQALTGQGGWPMTVFMTADGKPFYAGTYYPPTDAHGRPGFPRLLASIRHAWDHDRERLLASAESITDRLRESTSRPPSGGRIDEAMLAQAVDRFRATFDPVWGGFGTAPKFPSPSNLEFLLAHGAITGDTEATNMAIATLLKMGAGGMYDHVGGGFSRYSVDQRWLVPHFEKMLYDNVQLARAYLHAYQVTGDSDFARIARETLDFLAREMRHPAGAFFSAQDADSEGIEGKFYVWTPDELEAVLGDDATDAIEWFAVTPEGNFLDPHHPEFGRRTVLSFPRDRDTIAAERSLSRSELDERIDSIRTRLRAERETRIAPGLDDKCLTSWNGLALAAFAEAARILGDARYREIAEANAALIREAMWDGVRLLHTWKDGVARIDGLLEDYAYYGLGLVELYKLTGDLAHLEWAADLLRAILTRFRDPEHGGFFESPADGEPLLLRQKPFFDSATPGENSAVAQLAWWLGRYYGLTQWEQVVDECAAQVADHAVAAANGFGALLLACQIAQAPRREIVIVGDPDSRAPFEAEVATRFLPATLIAPGSAGTALPMFEDRGVEGAAAYVCEDMVCQLPATSPAALSAQLG